MLSIVGVPQSFLEIYWNSEGTRLFRFEGNARICLLS